MPPYDAERRPESHYLSRAENAKLADPQPLLAWWDELIELDKLMQAAFMRRDTAALREVVQQIRLRAPKSPSSPVPHSSIATALRALGQLTGDRGAYRDSVRASMKTIALGFAVPRTLELALASATRAQDMELMQELLALAVQTGLVPDVSCADRVHAIAQRSPSHAELALRLVNRARVHANRSDHAKIDGWLAATKLAPAD